MIADVVGLLLVLPVLAAMWCGAYYGIRWLQKHWSD